MSNRELLTVKPLDLQFPFELEKQIPCSLYLTNITENNNVAFKVKSTNLDNYGVKPSTGVILPSSTCEVLVTLKAQNEAPIDMQCKDRFLILCVIANPGVTAKEVTSEMFSKKAGHLVEKTELKVTYVHEGSKESSSPRASVSDNGHASEFSTRDLIAKLTEEKQSAIQLNKKLQRQLDELRGGSKRSRNSCVPYMIFSLINQKYLQSLKISEDKKHQ